MGNVADIRLTISVDGSSVKPATDEVAKAFGVLKAKTVAEINKQKSEINAAYEAIRKSGTVSAGEIGQAWAAKNKQIAELDKEMLAQQNGVFNTLKGCWLQLVGWATAAIMAIRWAWRLMEEAAAYQDQVSQLESLAKAYNTTADSIISDIENITGGMISMSGIVAVAVQGMTRGLDPAQLKELAKYADAVGDTMKTSAAEGFRALAEGAALGRERTLENIVGVIDLNAVLGDQVNKMNDAEKAQARMNIMLERLRNVYPAAGNETKSFGDKMEALTATVKNLQLWLSTGLIRATGGAVAAFQWLSASFLTLASGFWHALRPIEWLLEKLKLVKGGFVKGAAEEAWRLAQEQTGKAADNFEAMIASSEKLAAAMAKPRNEMDNFTDSTKNLNDLNNALRDFENQISGMDPALSETDRALMRLDADYDTLIEKIDRMQGLSQSAKDAMKDSALQAWGKGRDLIWEADAKKRFEAMYQAQKESAAAREELEKGLTAAYSFELDKQLTETEDWAKKQHELNFKSFTDILAETGDLGAAWKQFEENRTRITEATASKRAGILDTEAKKQRDSYLESMSGLATAYEQATDLTRQWGETDEEYTKRVLIEKTKWKDLLIDGIKQLALTGDIGSEAYDKLIKKLEELGIATADVDKTFEDGIKDGMEDYIKSLEYGYDKGKQLTQETASTLMSSFQTMFFDNFKNGLDSLYTYFKNTLSKMVTEALMKPIVVEISAGFTSTLKDLKSTLSNGGSSLLNLLGIGGTGYGLGTSLFGSKESGYGGAVGGLGGYILGSMFTQEIAGAIGDLLGAEIGFAIFNAIPGIGAILGALLGSFLGSLFKKKPKVPKLGLAYSETGDFPDLKYGGTYTYEDYYGFVSGGGAGEGIDEREMKSALSMFKQYRENVMEVLTTLGLDISGFYDTWSMTIDTEGKEADEIEQDFKDMMANYIEFASGIDFDQFAQDGETFSDTVERIVTALAQVAAVISGKWDEDSASGWDIQKMYDSIDLNANTYKEALDNIDSKIADAVSELDSLTGQDWGDKITEIGELLADRYETELEYLEYIKGLQESIAEGFQSLKDEIDLAGMTEGERLTHYFNQALADYNAIMAEADPVKLEELSQSLLDSTGTFVSILLSLKDRIKSLTDTIKQNLETIQTASMGSYEIAKYYWDKSQTLASAYVNATDIEDKIRYGELLTGSINDLFNSLQTLQGAFDNLKESADKTLRSMRMSMMSPTQKVDYINTEITEAYAKYKEAKAADEYGQMTYWGQRITELANEGWALGIDQQASFANVAPLLEEISADMATASQATTDVIEDILVPALEYLQNEMLNFSVNIDQALNAVKDVLTTLNTTIQDKLITAINNEITALNALRDQLDSINWTNLGGSGGGSGGSGSGSSAYSFTLSDAGYLALYNSSTGAIKYDMTEPDYTGPAYSGYTKLSGSAIEFYDALNNLVGSLSWYKIGDVQYVGGYPLTSHATGLDYVPYDNYGALLHKGEAVVTARGNEALGRALDRLERIEQRLNSNNKDGQVIVLNINGDLDRILDITAEELEGRVIKTVRRNPAVLTGR